MACRFSAGEGPFGLGWSLRIPQKSRRIPRCVPTYGAAGSTDVFQLSGEDDLVPWLEAKSDGQLTPCQDKYAHWAVNRYRPRNEHVSARIEQLSTPKNHQEPGHWRVTNNENVTDVYGFHAGARVSDPLDPFRFYAWLLQEVRDDRGTVVLYHYKGDDGNGVNRESVHEMQRGIGKRNMSTAQGYLKRMLYANLAPERKDRGNRCEPLFWTVSTPHRDRRCHGVVLDYGAHDADDPSVDEQDLWPARPEGLSAFLSGFEIRTLRQWHRVLVFHRTPPRPAVSGQPASPDMRRIWHA